MFRKILIANRGEIAVRVLRTAREMGIRTVAVYSDADRTSQHTRLADEAVYIGGSQARESYLRMDKILDAAKAAGAEAIHPGYGFLSENGEFAQAVTDAGIAFIGPPPSAIKAMGSKTAARRMMAAAGVPIVPGVQSGLADSDAALEAAERIGYPVLLKAAMGGGGKGMRVAHDATELPGLLAAARREALSAFGDDEVYLERYIAAPRHIEIQILADSHGNCIHLYERECSIQRRHQKVIEEAPSPALADKQATREAMGAAAVAAGMACGYQNAGTVEFLYDDATGGFYFLEMNTRLQVEHPVTEFVTGLDLVREQLLIAAGNPLTIKQEDIAHRGHAIECRIYAEDTAAGFMPAAGKIVKLTRPAGPWVRIDSGVTDGDDVGVYYDPLIAKLVVWGADRDGAIARMHRALSEYRITGLKTTIPFCRSVMENQSYRDGNFDTNFVEREFVTMLNQPPDPELLRTAAIAAAIAETERTTVTNIVSGNHKASSNGSSGWKRAGRERQMR